MFAQILADFTEAAEINDARQGRAARRLRKRRSQQTIPHRIVRARRSHRMHQVKRGLTSFKMTAEGIDIGEVHSHDFYIWMFCPFASEKLFRRAHQATNRVASVKQSRNKSSADVASRTCDRNTLYFFRFGQSFRPSAPDCFVFCSRRISKPCEPASAASRS